MKVRTRIFALAFVLALLGINRPDAGAVWLHLTDEQRQEAVRFGERSSWKQLLLQGEWVRESGGNKAVMQTPFLILAAMAKRASQQYRKLSKEEMDALLKELEGKLTFFITVTGYSPDFAKDYHAVIKADGKTIQPILKQNPSLASPVMGYDSVYYTANCIYVFPAEGIDPNGQLTLIMISPLGREWKFHYDLSKIK